MQALGVWMFISKFIKLLGHYIRFPVDCLLLPVSILFGYFHGGIKMYAVLTLNVVSNKPLVLVVSFLACNWQFSSLQTPLVFHLPDFTLPFSPLGCTDGRGRCRLKF